MPMELPNDASGFGAWRMFVLASGLADAVSRTATAPIDRLKIQLQVRPNSVTTLVQTCLKTETVETQMVLATDL